MEHTKTLFERLSEDTTPTGVWLLEKFKKSSAAVEEFMDILNEAGFKTLGHAWAQKNKSIILFLEFLKLGRIEKTKEDILLMTLAEFQLQLGYALRFRESNLLRKEIKLKSVEQEKEAAYSYNPRYQWGQIMRTPVEELSRGNGFWAGNEDIQKLSTAYENSKKECKF
jgi:hypothetical protein